MIDRKGSPIPPAVGSLLTARGSQVNGCSLCVGLDSATLLKRGVANEKVEALPAWRESDLFDDDAIVELTGLIAFQKLSSKFNSALGVPAQGFSPLPRALAEGSAAIAAD
jgi:AhpD family alkylhydroperoxidase